MLPQYTNTLTSSSPWSSSSLFLLMVIFHAATETSTIMTELESKTNDNWINWSVSQPISSRYHYNYNRSNSCGSLNEIIRHLIMSYGFKSIDHFLSALEHTLIRCSSLDNLILCDICQSGEHSNSPKMVNGLMLQTHLFYLHTKLVHQCGVAAWNFESFSNLFKIQIE